MLEEYKYEPQPRLQLGISKNIHFDLPLASINPIWTGNGGGGGGILPRHFKPKYLFFFFNICANTIKLDDFFKNLSRSSLMYS